MIVLVLIGITCVHFLLPIILPNYIGATATIYVLLLSVPLKFSDALSQVLVASNRVAALNLISIICTAVQIAVSLILAYLGLGIISFAIGFLVGYFTRTLTLLINIIFKIKEEGVPC